MIDRRSWMLEKIQEQENLTAPLEIEGDNYYPEYARSYFLTDCKRISSLYERRLAKLKRFTDRLVREQGAGAAEQSALLAELSRRKEAFAARPDADCIDFGDWMCEVFGK